MPEGEVTNPPTDPGEDDGGNPGRGSKGSDDLISRTEFDKVVSQRQEYKNELRSLQARLDGLEKRKTDDEYDSSRKKGDVEGVERAWQAKYSDLEKKYEEVETRYKRKTIEDEFRKIAQDKVVDPDGFLQMFGSRLKSQVDGDDREVLVVQDGEIKRTDVDKWLNEVLEQKPYLAKSKAKPGGGVPNPGRGGDADGSDELPADFASWSRERRKEWTKKQGLEKVYEVADKLYR